MTASESEVMKTGVLSTIL